MEKIKMYQSVKRIRGLYLCWKHGEKSYNFYGIKTYEAEGKHWDQTTP
jgi:hypothetical protein